MYVRIYVNVAKISAQGILFVDDRDGKFHVVGDNSVFCFAASPNVMGEKLLRPLAAKRHYKHSQRNQVPRNLA